jgi:dihydroflavonol-4-reductase
MFESGCTIRFIHTVEGHFIMSIAGDDNRTVLVTGGSGYLASWTIVVLLQRGYRVRTTVRDLSRAPMVRAMIATQVDAADRLSFVRANLLADDGWSEATDGAQFVIHTASPMPVGEYQGTDLVGPALDGTGRVLSAAHHSGVRRVVLTSSGDAATPPKNSGAVADETIWTDVPEGHAFDYQRAKVLAERAAWAFAGANPEMELSTVLPAFMQGPVLGSDYSGSVSVVAMLLSGKLPAIPRLGWSVVDVRDVVDLHIMAMTSPKAAGERFVGAGDFLWISDMATILRESLGDRGRKVPRRMLPNAFVRLAALVNRDMKEMVPRLGIEQRASSAKARRILGWSPRPAAEAIIDGARSLIDYDLV